MKNMDCKGRNNIMIKELINKAYNEISKECDDSNEYCNPCDLCKYNKPFKVDTGEDNPLTICEMIHDLYCQYNKIY